MDWIFRSKELYSMLSLNLQSHRVNFWLDGMISEAKKASNSFLNNSLQKRVLLGLHLFIHKL